MSSHSTRALVSRCRQQVRQMESAIPFATLSSFADLCQRLAQWRNRPLELASFELPLQIDGFWLATEQADYIVFASNASRLAQEHAICHELGHMLLGHRTRHGDLQQALQGLISAPTLQPVPALRSEERDTAAEQEAECFALLLAERLPFEAWGSMDITPLPAVGSAERALLERYITTLFAVDE